MEMLVVEDPELHLLVQEPVAGRVPPPVTPADRAVLFQPWWVPDERVVFEAAALQSEQPHELLAHAVDHGVEGGLRQACGVVNPRQIVVVGEAPGTQIVHSAADVHRATGPAGLVAAAATVLWAGLAIRFSCRPPSGRRDDSRCPPAVAHSAHPAMCGDAAEQ
ncbi:hypothetical protein AB0H73_28040 [Streptomyces olivoreticuli]|uniref:hypothetical protein n=1 Tax=Streptomyces olivoreticuli TaxID=68246 RepID=UPI0013C3156B|nr:hypothetical protein [Streptomyces olivoreticuli]